MAYAAILSARAHRRWLRRRLVIVPGLAIAAVLLAPLVLLALDANSAGWSEISQVLFRQRSRMLLTNTVVLAVLVLVLASAIGIAAAWATERCALPARRAWTVLLVLPIAMPDFVTGWAWHSIAPRMSPLLGAMLVMTLGTYPLVYLPVSAALRSAAPAMEDPSRSLGAGAIASFVKVTLPLISRAVVGGGVLVVLTVISEYGAFEVPRYQTFTTQIFHGFGADPAAAGALPVPRVLLGLLALPADGLTARRGRPRTAPARPPAL